MGPAEERETLAFQKDRWHRAYLTRMLAESRTGSAKQALVAVRAGRARRVPNARGFPDSVAVLEAYFAALDGKRDAALAAAKRVDPAKDDDVEDLYLVVVGLEAGGDHAGAEAVRRVMRAAGGRAHLARDHAPLARPRREDDAARLHAVAPLMPYFIAVPSPIADCALHFDAQFNGKVRKNGPGPLASIRRTLESPKRTGTPIDADVCIRMSADFPKAKRTYDLHLLHVVRLDALLVSTRVHDFLVTRRLESFDAHAVTVHDPKNKKIEGTFYIIRQLDRVKCLAEAKCVVSRFDDGRIFAAERVVLDDKRAPKRGELFRPAEYGGVLFVTDDLAHALVAAGFVGLDYVRDEHWKANSVLASKLLFKGPTSMATPTKPTKLERSFPSSIASLVKKHHGNWIDLDYPTKLGRMSAWIFDWRELASSARKAFDDEDLLLGAGEDPDGMPFGVLHSYDDLAKELGRKPQTLRDALGAQTNGLLMCDEKGIVFHLDAGSRVDLAPSVAKLKFKPRSARK